MDAIEVLVLAVCIANACVSVRLLTASKFAVQPDAPRPHLEVKRRRAEIISVSVPPKPDLLALYRDACGSIAAEYGLTQRESEVFLRLASGRSTMSIAEEMILSNATIKSHSCSIYRKLDVHTRDQLIGMVEHQLAS